MSWSSSQREGKTLFQHLKSQKKTLPGEAELHLSVARGNPGTTRESEPFLLWPPLDQSSKLRRRRRRQRLTPLRLLLPSSFCRVDFFSCRMICKTSPLLFCWFSLHGFPRLPPTSPTHGSPAAVRRGLLREIMMSANCSTSGFMRALPGWQKLLCSNSHALLFA